MDIHRIAQGGSGFQLVDYLSHSLINWPLLHGVQVVRNTLARLHGVAPLLHERLRATGRLPELPAETREILGAARRLTAFENLRHYAELRRIAKALNGRGIPLIALKGLHLAELVYVEPSLRPMSDMDILVPRMAVGAAG